MNLLSKQAIYYKCRDGAAADDYALSPPNIYVYRGRTLPAAIAAFERCGVLERLDGAPSVGIDVIEMRDEWFNTPARIEPVEERPMKREEMLKWLQWDDAKLARMRSHFNFPAATVTFAADRPDQAGAPGWMRSDVERWMAERPELASA